MASSLYSKHLNNKKALYLRTTVLVTILGIFAVISLFPLAYMFTWSFGPAVDTASTSYSLLPSKWTFDSYKYFVDYSPYSLTWLWNSLVVATCTVIGNVIFAGMAGYAFAKINFRGRKWLFYLVLMSMMIPYQVTQVPLYILFVSKFKMTNTFAGLILPGVCSTYNIFLSKQFFSGIPTALIESAKIEGCGHIRIYRLIVLPLSKTILAVMAINTFLGSWNNFFWPFLVTSSDAMYTIQVGLKTFKFANGTLLSPMLAGACISAIPMFILFFSLQKYFLEGVTVGAVKG
ncbi:MAG: carbohydrate ABC transporter permease [Eubacteriales bacterium]